MTVILLFASKSGWDFVLKNLARECALVGCFGGSEFLLWLF